MYVYYSTEVAIISLIVSAIVCNIAYIYNFFYEDRNGLEAMVYIQAIFIAALLLLYGVCHHVSIDRMETGLRENFIPDTNCHHLDTQRYHLYDGFGNDDWYKNGVKSPDFLGMYDSDTGTFTYYVKLESFDVLKR